MNVEFLEAISTLLTLQRWNFVPRIETWTEAENVAYVLHLIYAVGRASNLQIKDIERALTRAVVKSFNKHFVSDISHYTRKAINDVEPGLWRKFEKDSAKKTLKLFPSELHEYIREMLITPLEKNVDDLSVDDKLLGFIQMKVAETECATNKSAYPA